MVVVRTNNKKRFLLLTSLACFSFHTSITLAGTAGPTQTTEIDNVKLRQFVLQMGAYWSKPGQAQHIDIQTLIGDGFTVYHQQDSHGLIGLGYYWQAAHMFHHPVNFGINAFYLPKISVSGVVMQEALFPNLNYRYHVNHLPIYAMAQLPLHAENKPYGLVLDAGIGPNLLAMTHFKEDSLDGITTPDKIFANHTATTFSATVGINLEVDNIFGQMPVKCGYRLFYLGQGHLEKANFQVMHNLQTAHVYANALICAFTI